MNANQKAFVTKLSLYKRQKTNKVSFQNSGEGQSLGRNDEGFDGEDGSSYKFGGFSFGRGGGGWQCFSSLTNYKSINDLSITHNILKLFTTCTWIVEGNNTKTKH